MNDQSFSGPPGPTGFIGQSSIAADCRYFLSENVFIFLGPPGNIGPPGSPGPAGKYVIIQNKINNQTLVLTMNEKYEIKNKKVSN